MYRGQVLEGLPEHRHPRRQPLDHLRPAPRQRHLLERDRLRLAGGHIRHAGPDHRKHDLHRLLPHDLGLLRRRQQLRLHRGGQPAPARARHECVGQRRLRLQCHPTFPSNTGWPPTTGSTLCSPPAPARTPPRRPLAPLRQTMPPELPPTPRSRPRSTNRWTRPPSLNHRDPHRPRRDSDSRRRVLRRQQPVGRDATVITAQPHNDVHRRLEAEPAVPGSQTWPATPWPRTRSGPSPPAPPVHATRRPTPSWPRTANPATPPPNGTSQASATGPSRGTPPRSASTGRHRPLQGRHHGNDYRIDIYRLGYYGGRAHAR